MASETIFKMEVRQNDLNTSETLSPVSSSNFPEGFLHSWEWIRQYPGYATHGSHVTVITRPGDFYDMLLEKIRSAKHRVYLASLYLGTGSLEQSLIDTLKSNLVDNPQLKVQVLLDYARGSRGKQNSRTMLLPLIKEFDSCKLFLYHTPRLRGPLKSLLPERWNEIVGLQHMKIYIFDDCLLMTGANLSNDYFTNRQDRYVLIEGCKDLVNFYEGLINEVTTFCFQLDGQDNVSLHPTWKVHPSDGDQNEFVNEARNRIESYYERSMEQNDHRLRRFEESSHKEPLSPTAEYVNNEVDTWIFPLIQLGDLTIRHDNAATSSVFKSAPPNSKIKLATGYFNLTDEYVQMIIQDSKAEYDILMAHPKANGFFNARGFAGGIPAAYTLLAKFFHSQVKDLKQQDRIRMWEYIRSGWTFHAKGLWYYNSSQDLPTATLIGSPNFGYRSVHLDMETQLYLITNNLKLRHQLSNEHSNLETNCKPFSDHVLATRSRHVPLWVRMVIMLFKRYF